MLREISNFYLNKNWIRHFKDKLILKIVQPLRTVISLPLAAKVDLV